MIFFCNLNQILVHSHTEICRPHTARTSTCFSCFDVHAIDLILLPRRSASPSQACRAYRLVHIRSYVQPPYRSPTVRVTPSKLTSFTSSSISSTRHKSHHNHAHVISHLNCYVDASSTFPVLTSYKPQPHIETHSTPGTPLYSSHPHYPIHQSAPRPYQPSHSNGNFPLLSATPTPATTPTA